MKKKSLAGFLIICLLSAPVYCLDLGHILDKIRVAIGDASSDENNRHWGTDLLTDRVNIVQDFICTETLCIEARISTHSIAEVQEYTYASDMIDIYRMSYLIKGSSPAAYRRIEWTTLAALDADTGYPDWEDDNSGEPKRYYKRGGNIYGLHPKPSSVYVSTYAVNIDYYRLASSITADGDIPFDGELILYPYHELFIKGVVIMCLKDDGINSTAEIVEYNYLIQKMKDNIKNRRDKSN